MLAVVKRRGNGQLMIRSFAEVALENGALVECHGRFGSIGALKQAWIGREVLRSSAFAVASRHGGSTGVHVCVLAVRTVERNFHGRTLGVVRASGADCRAISDLSDS